MQGYVLEELILYDKLVSGQLQFGLWLVPGELSWSGGRSVRPVVELDTSSTLRATRKSMKLY